MSKKLNITYSSATDKNISVGEFEIECYTSVSKALGSIFEEVQDRIKTKAMKKISLTIELIEPKED